MHGCHLDMVISFGGSRSLTTAPIRRIVLQQRRLSRIAPLRFRSPPQQQLHSLRRVPPAQPDTTLVPSDACRADGQ